MDPDSLVGLHQDPDIGLLCKNLGWPTIWRTLLQENFNPSAKEFAYLLETTPLKFQADFSGLCVEMS